MRRRSRLGRSAGLTRIRGRIVTLFGRPSRRSLAIVQSGGGTAHDFDGNLANFVTERVSSWIFRVGGGRRHRRTSSSVRGAGCRGDFRRHTRRSNVHRRRGPAESGAQTISEPIAESVAKSIEWRTGDSASTATGKYGRHLHLREEIVEIFKWTASASLLLLLRAKRTRLRETCRLRGRFPGRGVGRWVGGRRRLRTRQSRVVPSRQLSTVIDVERPTGSAVKSHFPARR